MISLLLLGCGNPDAKLSLADAQTVGTHNSYHIDTSGFAPWAYTHPRLDEQVVSGIRQFELDLDWNGSAWEVFHLAIIDAGTTCGILEACLQDLEAGSEAVPNHLPLMVLLELKTAFADVADPDAALLAIDQALRDHVGEEGLLLPAAIQGDAGSLREALVDGWPVLEGQRGRIIPVIHDRGAWSERGRALDPGSTFFDAYGDLNADWAAIHSLNDPFDPAIEDVVLAGQLVRTRADADVIEPAANDTARRDQALASGAHFVSTDFPQPHPRTGYVVEVGERAARCNPVHVNRACTPERLSPDLP